MNVTPEENAAQEAALRENAPNEKEAQNLINGRRNARVRGSGVLPAPAPLPEAESSN